MTARASILVDPFPRREDMIFTAATRRRLEAVAELHCYWGEGRMPDEAVEQRLPTTDIILGQTHLDAARIDRARRLKAVINVKANWEPHIDYAALQARGVHVLSVAPCMAPAVAEWCLGAAIDLVRRDGLALRDSRPGGRHSRRSVQRLRSGTRGKREQERCQKGREAGGAVHGEALEHEVGGLGVEAWDSASLTCDL
jgi:phosphoglycerate dehydrogenase-like enzyme